jgi:hypothetical protein
MRRILILCLAAMALAACQSEKAPAPAAGGKSAALRAMEQVATAAHRCWFASGDAAFKGYSFANELNSFSGRPRFLLVPKNNYGGRPLLVVQSEGPSGRVDVFGPIMQQPLGQRVSADVHRWASGDAGCGGRA